MKGSNLKNMLDSQSCAKLFKFQQIRQQWPLHNSTIIPPILRFPTFTMPFSLIPRF